MKTDSVTIRIVDGYSNPRFKKLIKKGKGEDAFPNNLLIGFELETVLKGDAFSEKEYYTSIVLNKEHKHLKDVFYAKHDGSVEGSISANGRYERYQGIEINSHPFNWNWFHSNKKYFYDLAKFLEQTKSYCNRTCGFHVHINKSYFKDKVHIDRFLLMFYKYPNFILKISKRGSRDYLEEMANPWIFNAWSRPTVKAIADSFRGNGNGDYEYQGGEKYLAANTYHRNTIEVRVFQSTINPVLFSAYMEFCVALAIYTENTKNELTLDAFKLYVKRNHNRYPNLKESNLLNKPSETSYRSSVSSIKKNKFFGEVAQVVKRNTKRNQLTEKEEAAIVA